MAVESIRSRDIREGVYAVTQSREYQDCYEKRTLSAKGREIFQSIRCEWPADLIAAEVARAVDA